MGILAVAIIVVGTAIAGVRIISRQGLQTFLKTLSRLQEGRSGLLPMVDGLLIVTAGILLLLPGLMTDAIGLMLLIPQVRQLVFKAGLLKLLAGEPGDEQVFGKGGKPREPRPTGDPVYNDPGSGVVIEGEYERVDEEPVDTPVKSSRRGTFA